MLSTLCFLHCIGLSSFAAFHALVAERLHNYAQR